MRMDSVVIISDYLLSVAKEHQALERGVIRSWNEISKDTIHEDVIIIDTKLNLEEDKSGNSTVVGKSTFDLLEFLRVCLPNLLNQGKTILALCNPVEQILQRQTAPGVRTIIAGYYISDPFIHQAHSIMKMNSYIMRPIL